MWFDKENPRTVFADIRQEAMTLCDGRWCKVKPDTVADFRAMPFADGEFSLVVFDPPHLVRAGEESWLRKKYGVLDPDNWQDDVRKGFAECWRVLRPGGTLVFKWSDLQVKLGEVLPLMPARPLFGFRRGRGIFVVLNKPHGEAE